MANTYSSVYLHIIFAVKNRESLLPPFLRPEVYQYMSAIINSRGHTTVKIGGTANHVHIAIGYNINERIPDFIRDLKASTSRFINQKTACKFAWQHGYGVFSLSYSRLAGVAAYIANQEEHHRKVSLTDEMRNILEGYALIYDNQYLFDDITE